MWITLQICGKEIDFFLDGIGDLEYIS